MAKKVSEVYRYAQALQEHGEPAKALTLYLKIIENCPESKAAAASRKRVFEIRQKHGGIAPAVPRPQAKKRPGAPQQAEGANVAADDEVKKLERYPFFAAVFLIFGVGLALVLNLFTAYFAPFGRTPSVYAFCGTGVLMALVSLIISLLGRRASARVPELKKKDTIFVFLSIAAMVVFGAVIVGVMVLKG